ncbi:MAG TPA: ABC transporter permease [Chthoniobacterales bacterium]|nr:ABC transporter permease [Chthoniobacterales bacterium]
MSDSTAPATISGGTSATTPANAEPKTKEVAKNDGFDIWLEAGRTEKHYWLDLWRYRELFLILAWRDVAVRYKQTVVGVAWSLIQPLLTMLIMTVVFSKLAGLNADGNVPYAILVLSGMLPWQFFANALAFSGQSLVGNSTLISKIYFPRLLIPASTAGVALVDFLISLLILAGMMIFYQFAPTWRLLLVPVLLVIAFITSLGPGLLVGALTVQYRDFRFILPFAIQFGLYLCPVGFSSGVVREKLGDTLFLLYSLNPMVGVIDGFRWAILGGASSFYLPGFLISLTVSAILLGIGVWYFRKIERTFADII